MKNEIIDPVTDPYSAAQQALIELIRAGKIESADKCFVEYNELLRLYQYIEKLAKAHEPIK